MSQRESRSILISRNSWKKVILFMGLLGIAYFFSIGNLVMGTTIALIPIICLFLIKILTKAELLYYLALCINFSITSISRYINLPNVSLLVDLLMVFIAVILIIQTTFKGDVKWKQMNNVYTYSMLIWTIYCFLEIVNPSGVLKAWIYSRSLTIDYLIWCILASILLYKPKHLNQFIFIYSILILITIIKCMIQINNGFDSYEMAWLMDSGSYTTHLLSSGTRYFSILSDAGNFGSNMGCAGIAFIIMGFYFKNNIKKIFSIILGILGIWAMFQSGTRGAIAVPLGGLILLIVTSKKIKIMGAGSILLMIIYVFFAFTYIGEGNAQIRRMRTAFKPTEDPSFLVRKNHQRQLGAYLKTKPFGEGIGLAGVENFSKYPRFTTSIPTDSWFVSIWVQTGVIGLFMYAITLIVPLGFGCYTIMFKLKDRETKGKLIGLMGGTFGLMISAYGNNFYGQFPTPIITITILSLAVRGTQFDPILEKERKEKEKLLTAQKSQDLQEIEEIENDTLA